jgi:hypothetical protein
MKKPEPTKKDDEITPILEFIQGIKDGRIDPTKINKKKRQECVEVLYLDGWTNPNMEQFLKCSYKTIQRDIEEISEGHSIVPNPKLAMRLIGNYLMKSRIHEAYLMRLARGREGSVGEKGTAEYLAHKVHDETMRRLQSLGCLPNATQQIAADIFHHKEDESKTIQAYTEEINTIESSLKRAGMGGSVASHDALREIKEGLRKLTEVKEENSAPITPKEDAHES